MKSLLKLLFISVFVSCSSVKVVSDYDTKTDFTKYKTFHFFEDYGEGLSELDKKRVYQILESRLLKKDLVVSENPDFFINVLSSERSSEQRNTIGIGIGGGRNVGFGISGGIPIESRSISQEITVDFVDAKTNTIIWQGIATSKLKESTTPQERDAHYVKVIEKILVEYPPKK